MLSSMEKYFPPLFDCSWLIAVCPENDCPLIFYVSFSHALHPSGSGWHPKWCELIKRPLRTGGFIFGLEKSIRKSNQQMAPGEEENRLAVHVYEEQCPGTVGYYCVGTEGALIEPTYGVCTECRLCWGAWVAKRSKKSVDKKRLRDWRILWRYDFNLNLVKGPVQAYVEVVFFTRIQSSGPDSKRPRLCGRLRFFQSLPRQRKRPPLSYAHIALKNLNCWWVHLKISLLVVNWPQRPMPMVYKYSNLMQSFLNANSCTLRSHL